MWKFAVEAPLTSPIVLRSEQERGASYCEILIAPR